MQNGVPQSGQVKNELPVVFLALLDRLGGLGETLILEKSGDFAHRSLPFLYACVIAS
jgi:hypothetical protein